MVELYLHSPLCLGNYLSLAAVGNMWSFTSRLLIRLYIIILRHSGNFVLFLGDDNIMYLYSRETVEKAVS
jgi:hypothetical protein